MTAELFSGDFGVFGPEPLPMILPPGMITCRFQFYPPPSPLMELMPREIMAYRTGLQDGSRYIAHWQGQAKAWEQRAEQADLRAAQATSMMRDVSLTAQAGHADVTAKLLAIGPAQSKDVADAYMRGAVVTGVLCMIFSLAFQMLPKLFGLL